MSKEKHETINISFTIEKEEFNLKTRPLSEDEQKCVSDLQIRFCKKKDLNDK